MTARVAVLKFPGSNCEAESVRALARAGLGAEIVRWNERPESLLEYDAYLLPGGFSYQDRVRAGAIAARLPVLEVLATRAREGAPVWGICNGAQILVESGLVPGDPGGSEAIGLALAPNRIADRDPYYTRWVYLVPGPGAERCLFTRGLSEPLPMPMAHGEGRFVTADAAVARSLPDRLALAYARPDGRPDAAFPWTPNGSALAAAGVANVAGNVLALMPHPERAQVLAQVPPWLEGAWGERRRQGHTAEALEVEGPGMFLFHALARALQR